MPQLFLPPHYWEILLQNFEEAIFQVYRPVDLANLEKGKQDQI